MRESGLFECKRGHLPSETTKSISYRMHALDRRCDRATEREAYADSTGPCLALASTPSTSRKRCECACQTVFCDAVFARDPG